MANIDLERKHGDAATVSTALYSRINWGAVIAGLVIALGLQLVLGLAGAATGLAAYDVGDSGRPFGIGAAIWALLTPLIALFVGGMTTGRLAGVLSRKDGFLHGALVWALSTLFTVWLLGQGIGAVTGTAFRLAGNVVGGAASGVARGATAAAGEVAQNTDVDVSSIRSEIEQALRQTGNPALNPDSLANAAQQAGGAVTSGASNEQIAQQIGDLFRDRSRQVSREDIVNVLAARTDLDSAEAGRLADRFQTLGQQASAQVAQVQERAGEVVDNTADATSTGLWLLLLTLGLSLAAASFGAMRTAPE